MSIPLPTLAVSSALLLGACSPNPYVIGAACPGADGPGPNAKPCGTAGAAGAGDSGQTFAIDLDQSGTSFLADSLDLPGGTLQAALRLRGENATASAWPADSGSFRLETAATPGLALPAPFTDGTQAVSLASDSPSYVAENAAAGSLNSDDFAIELVLRAATGITIADRRSGGVGWAVKSTPTGALVLELQDAERLLQIASEPLIAGAWYHCLFWVSRSAGGRADCNGRAGALVDASALGSLDPATTALAVGGGGASSSDRVELALLTIFDAKKSDLGDPASWDAVSRKRFAALTGVSPRVALGSSLPEPGLRDSAAYLDLQRGSVRSLFLVGPDWPRVACRSDAAGVRDCGYLSEPKRTRWVPPEAATWTPNELTLTANQAAFVDGERRMTALIPSAQSAPHTLSWTGTYGGARQALSFFVRAESGQFVAVSASNGGEVIFDLHAGTVVSSPPTARGAIEEWDRNVFRCAVIFAPDPGALTYQIELLSDASRTPFGGDGSRVWVDVAGLQLDVGAANPGSLLSSDVQLADTLSFVANDGNLPSSTAVAQSLRLLLPAGPRLTDEAVLSLNLGGDFANQVQLYVTGDTGELKFWGLRGGDTHWAFNHPASFVDGLRHAV